MHSKSLMGEREMPGVGEVELITLKTFSITVSSTKDLTPYSYRPRNSLMSQSLCNLFSFLNLHFLFLLTVSLSYSSHPCSFVAIVFSKFLVYCGIFQEINEHSSLFYIKVICIFFTFVHLLIVFDAKGKGKVHSFYGTIDETVVHIYW